MFRGLRALLGRVERPAGLGLYGLVQPTPLSTPDIVPEGGTFVDATYSSPAGSRAYKLFIPSGYHGQALPLVVMLHGCTQSPDDFAAGTRMNLMLKKRPAWSSILPSPVRRMRRSAGTGSARATSGVVEVNLR
jgi:hypothetical protein